MKTAFNLRTAVFLMHLVALRAVIPEQSDQVIDNEFEETSGPSNDREKRPVVAITAATCAVASRRVYCSYIERYDMDYFRSNIKQSDAISLELRRSVVDDFPEGAFRSLNVSSLTIHDSILSLFPSDAFMSLKPVVTFLDLSFNNIETLLPDSMANLQFKGNLQTLNLSSNRLQSLAQDAFRWFPELRTLVLSQNLLTSVARHTFTSGLVNLRFLDLGQNLLRQLDEEAFYSVFSLQVVDLSHNAISSIRYNSFLGLHRLEILNLDWNELATLETDTFHVENFPQLKMLTIEGNRFNCSCDLDWFKNFLKTIGVVNFGYATCLYPRYSLFGDLDFCERRLIAQSDK